MSEENSMKFNVAEDGTAGLPSEIVNNAPVGPMVGISALALNMALKYHDSNTVQDGTLYQQYKLEGKNMHGLHLDMVFDTAIQIEQHLVAANTRVAKMIVLAALERDESEAEPSDGEPNLQAQQDGEK